MPTMREILARREAIRGELRALHEGANGADLATEPRAAWDRLTAEAEALTAQEQRQALIDDLDRRSTGQTVPGSGDSGFDALAAGVTALDVIRAQLPGATDAGAGRAREVSQELARRSGRNPAGLYYDLRASAPMERRVFTTAAPAGGPGSNLIQTTVAGGSMIDRLRERVMVRRLGATVLGGLQGSLAIPRLKASATAAWVAENAAISASDPQTDQVSLSPKHCGGIVEISRNMVMQPSLNVANLVAGDLAQLLAVALDKAAIKGGGTSEPAGLLASGSGIGSVAGGTDGLAPSWDNVLALIAAVDSANALDGSSLAFLTNAKVVKTNRTTLKTSGDTASTFLQSDPNMLAGYPLASTQNVPSDLTKGSGTGLSALIFGDWSQLFIGFWSELDILVNPYESTAYSKGNVQVRAMMTADVAIHQPKAFAAITDVITG